MNDKLTKSYGTKIWDNFYEFIKQKKLISNETEEWIKINLKKERVEDEQPVSIPRDVVADNSDDNVVRPVVPASGGGGNVVRPVVPSIDDNVVRPVVPASDSNVNEDEPENTDAINFINKWLKSKQPPIWWC